MSIAAVLTRLDGEAVARWATVGRDALADARIEIDALNVFPLADADTGTNLHLTLSAAVDALAASAWRATQVETHTAHRLMSALARGALTGARGSSGAILAQLLQGMAHGLAGVEGEVDAATLAQALGRGASEAYVAVTAPVEGTMLTVARRAAEAAQTAASASVDRASSLAAVVTAAADSAWLALAATPDQLPVLRAAGVVDAGGRGVCVLLDALVSVVTGVPVPTTAEAAASLVTSGSDSPDLVQRTVPGGEQGCAGGPDGADGADGADGGTGPAYEVMYLLDAAATAIPLLREALAPLGDAVVVVGTEPTWNVHVHVDDVGAAVEAGVEAGRPHGIRVTHFRDAARARANSLDAELRRVVVVVAGDGLADLVEAAGATAVRGGPGHRVTEAELLTGLRAARARDLVLLPNDPGSLAAAETAAGRARDEGLRVAVIPIRVTVQALAALAVHDPARRFEDDLVAMTAAAGQCRHGAVTVATREAVTMAGVCRPGDVLGIIDGDFAVIGHDLTAVACTVVDRMLGSGGELVTLVAGADIPPGLADAVAERARTGRPEVDTVAYTGGQAGYPLLIGVE